jgi:hypothetical protein
MMTDRDKELKLAKRVAGGATLKDHLSELLSIDGVSKFGSMCCFSVVEASQIQAFHDLVAMYIQLQAPPRPLCLAVFGPPGSGKSYAVKEVVSALAKDSVKLPLTTLNLTQMSDTDLLAGNLVTIANKQDEETVPVVFFDEFDAPRGAAPYGWLSWFLAPMHDGEFVYENARIPLRRAVYVFAGATAAKFEEFAERQRDGAFRSAKGPDFVSRLRGFLNVEGPNAQQHKFLRRAVILQGAVQKRAKTLGKGAVKPDPELLNVMLQVGRYRHGARSIEAVIEVSRVRPSRDKNEYNLSFEDLPEDHILMIHTDRGPLDPQAIQGPIVLSGGSLEGSGTIIPAWVKVAKLLWEAGATLASGGRWDHRAGPSKLTAADAEAATKLPKHSGANLVRSLAEELERLPKSLTRKGQVLVRLLTFPLKGVVEPPAGVRYVNSDSLTATEERALLREPAIDRDRIVQVLNLFRDRLAMAELSAARFAIGGKQVSDSGRYPGIAEEIMLTLALGRPVYVAGGFGGAAHDVGILLGLKRPWTGDLPRSFVLDEAGRARDASLGDFADRLRPPPLSKLPVRMHELVEFFKDHAIGGSLWPDNGLSVADNRTLFTSEDPDEIADLIIRGLSKRFATE